MNRRVLRLVLSACATGLVLSSTGGAGSAAPSQALAAEQPCGQELQTFGYASETSAVVGASVLDGHAYVVSRGQTPPAVTKIDLATREVVESVRLPRDGEGGWVIEGGWAATESGGQLYVGTYPLPYIYRVDPELDQATKVADLGRTGGFVFSLTTAPDGTVYAGTYPDGRIWEYSPETGQAEPLATPVPGADYARYVASDEEFVYASVYAPGHLVAVRRSDGTVRDLTPASLQGANFGPIEVTADKLVTSADGKLVVMDKDGSDVRAFPRAGIDALTVAEDGSVYMTVRPTGKVYVYRPGSDGPEAVATPSPGDEHRRLALLDGGKTLFGAGGSGATWWLDLTDNSFELLDLADAGAPTGPERPQSIVMDPGEATYVGGHWVVTRRDLDSGEKRRYRVPGEPKAMVVRNHLVYAALYPSGTIVELDPTTGKVRELTRIGHGQTRPWDMEYDESSGLLLVASAPGTGSLEGALTMVDPRTGTADVRAGVIPNQSVMTLSVENGVAYLGGDVRGGGGVTPVDQSASVAAFDLSERTVLWQGEPLAGNQTFQDLTVQDGVLYGVMKRDSGTWFAMDLAEREVLQRGRLSGYGEVQVHRGRVYASVFFGDGRIYQIGPDLEEARLRVSGLDDQWYTNPQLAFERNSWDAWGLYGRELARIRLDPRCPAVTVQPPEPVVATYEDALGLGYQSVPGAATTLTASPGERFVLWHSGMTVDNANELQQGENVRTSTAIMCRPLNGAAEGGADFTATLVPGRNDPVNPAVQWAFVAPHESGEAEYRCSVEVAFDSDTAPDSTDMKVTSDSGAVNLNARSTYQNVARWTLPADSEAVVSEGSSGSVLTRDYTARTDLSGIALRGTTQITYCPAPVAGGTGCGSTGTAPSAEGVSWLEAQPVDSTGAPCGDPFRSAKRSWRLNAGLREQGFLHALNLNPSSLPDGCGVLRTSLVVQHTAGEPVLVEGGRSGEMRTAATRGLAFQW